ncbi:hypothetical protein B6S12_05080 [Helicobacter valdiviensis]|uniref:Lipoprotein n=1 Tax=Helicobacter valdiviensis TaxID=1458358 RepID=A0A2W6MUJ7_9HELI|nr:hypothetical protein [Helicobacter valdiviensis]PZT48195.1 hypothetical protein B6S12_05080 [Helicobacter valdiviensis]
MKKIILCLLLGISLLKAECSVLGFELGVTTLKEIGKKTKLEIIDKNTARISPELFGIEGLEDVFFHFRGNVVYNASLYFKPTQEKYIELKKILESKYYLATDTLEKDAEIPNLKHGAFFNTDDKGCIVMLGLAKATKNEEAYLKLHYTFIPERKYL